MRLRIEWLLAVPVALAIAAPAHAKERSRGCTVAEKAAADRQLWLNERDKALAIATAMPWGVPPVDATLTDEWMLSQRDYVIRYDGGLRLPLFTAERVDFGRLGKVPRTDCFRADVRVEAASASNQRDYDEPIFDQGHLAAFANQDTSRIAGNNSFVMSNMAPQTCQFNRGIWQILEGVVRLWAKEAGTVFVVSGSVLDRDADGARDDDDRAARMASRNGSRRVAVPTAFYKVVAREEADGSVTTVAFLLPHTQDNPDGDAAVAYLRSHLTTLADIEARTGYRFFPDAAAISESDDLWPFERRRLPRSLCYAAPRPDFEALWAEPVARGAGDPVPDLGPGPVGPP